MLSKYSDLLKLLLNIFFMIVLQYRNLIFILLYNHFHESCCCWLILSTVVYCRLLLVATGCLLYPRCCSAINMKKSNLFQTVNRTLKQFFYFFVLNPSNEHFYSHRALVYFSRQKHRRRNVHTMEALVLVQIFCLTFLTLHRRSVYLSVKIHILINYYRTCTY